MEKHFRFKGTITAVEGSKVTIETFDYKEANKSSENKWVPHEGPYIKEPVVLPVELIGKTVRLIG